MFKNIKIGRKLILTGGIVLLLPIVFIGIIATRTASEGLREIEFEQLEMRTAEISLGIYNVLSAEKRIALDIALRKETKEALLKEREGFAGGWSDYEISLILADFVAQKGLGEGYSGINIINLQGQVIAASSEGRIGLDLAQRDYVINALKGNVFIGSPAVSMATGKPFFALSAPVYDDSDSIIGAAAIVVDLGFLWPLIENSTIGQTGYTFVTDRNGLIIAHPDPSLVFDISLQDLGGMEVITQRFLDGDSGTQEYVYKGEPKTAGFASVPETGWGVFLTIPDEEYLVTAHSVRNTVIIAAVVGFLFAMVIFILFSKTLTRPMTLGVNFAREISEGKLYTDIAVNQRDELGKLADALRDMQEKLRDVVSNVFDASVQVTNGSAQLAQSAEQLSQGANEQASTAEEVSSSVEEMGANIQQNTENAAETETISSRAATEAAEGGEAVLGAVQSMNKIAEKINIVSDIARQINMLSLNAAIEAARAGEQGKGFAVVAAEVGKLAGVSQQAANDISDLVTQSVIESNNAGEKIKKTVPNIQKTAELVTEISSSSREQSAGAGQISEAMIQLDQVIQQNASSAEEAAAMSEELSAQAEQLRSIVSFFRIEE